jgi:hypothetical protein
VPVLYSNTVDVGSTAVSIAQALLLQYDFNEGQRTISDSANIKANIRVTTDYDYEGRKINIISRVDSYNFEIQTGHPEAISEAISQVTENVEYYIYAVYQYEDTNPIAFTRGQALENAESLFATYKSAAASIGLFI